MSKKENIPENIFIHCPANGFRLSRAHMCIDCEHARGLLAHQPEQEAFEACFRIMCAHPIARRLERIDL